MLCAVLFIPVSSVTLFCFVLVLMLCLCVLIQFWCSFDLCWSLCCAYLCFDSVLVLLWQIQIDLGPGDTSTVLNFSSTVFHYSFTFHLFSIRCELNVEELLNWEK